MKLIKLRHSNKVESTVLFVELKWMTFPRKKCVSTSPSNVSNKNSLNIYIDNYTHIDREVMLKYGSTLNCAAVIVINHFQLLVNE